MRMGRRADGFRERATRPSRARSCRCTCSAGHPGDLPRSRRALQLPRRPCLFTPDAPPIAPSSPRSSTSIRRTTRLRVRRTTGLVRSRGGKSRATAPRAPLCSVVQLAKVAEPPPAGVSDPDAIDEARALVDVCAACAGSPRRTPEADAVRDLMRTCQDVWMAYASPAALREWVRDGTDDVFRDLRLLKLWTREAVRGVVRACDGVKTATSLGAIATSIVEEVGAGAGEDTEEVAWSRWRETRVLAAKFWALDERRAWSDVGATKMRSAVRSPESGERRRRRIVAGPDETKAGSGRDERRDRSARVHADAGG